MEKQKKSPDSAKKNDLKPKSKNSPELDQGAVSQQEVQYLTRCTRFRLSTEYELSICNCKHILRMTIGERHSVVNPQKWMCNVCATTESVWACLSCPNVACGRYIHEHALNHYLDSSHPLVIDVNELYVYCYECEEYVLNDNKSGDIKVLRETLQAIRYQNFTGTTRSGHTLRTAAISADEDVQMRRRLQQQQLDRDDRTFTAIWHSRFVRQRKTFRHWLQYVKCKKAMGLDQSSDVELDTNVDVFANMHSSNIEGPIYLQKPSLTTDTEADNETSQVLVKFQPPCHDTLPQTVKSAEIPPSLSPHQSTHSPSKSPSLNDEVASISSDFPENRISPKVVADSKPEMSENSSEIKEENTSSPSAKLTEVLPVTDPSSLDSAMGEANIIVVLTEDGETPDVEIKENKSPLATDAKTFDDLSVTEIAESSAEPAEPESPMTAAAVATEPAVDSSDIIKRPKRANAASRYRAIMNQLSPSLTNEPIKKRLRLFSKFANNFQEQSSKQEPYRRRSLRLSLRLIENNKKEPIKKKVKRNRKKIKKATPKPAVRSVRKRSKPERRLPSRTLPSRRTRMQNISKSIYDSVPNRAVTSLIPGVTGLRNLGNTCYLNSIIQVLGHLQKFRRCLLAVRDLEIEDKNNAAKTIATRRSTAELYENQASISVTRRFLKMQAGLNGGRESGSYEKTGDSGATYSPKRRLYSNSSAGTLSLCHELHDLYHVMWSGKWKLVSPYHFLSSVWQLIPSFRGYTQQDAQEFLCELLDKIVSELERKRYHSQASRAEGLASKISSVVHTVFEGRLHSQVRCLECKNVSSTFEPFWDLSLEFPQRYHSCSSNTWKNANQGCSLFEMLDKFTAAERLDGGRVYSCSYCNNVHLTPSRDTRQRRLSIKKTSQKLSEAEKQIKIVDLPQLNCGTMTDRLLVSAICLPHKDGGVPLSALPKDTTSELAGLYSPPSRLCRTPTGKVLRFHLKRFRWSGRNNREKITVPVNFPAELDMKPHCWMENVNKSADDATFIYDLSAVVIHHGRGFSAGHYTAYCWNDIGKFWVHCNDSNLELCCIDDVMASQAYILFYSQRGLDPHPHLFTPPSTPPATPDHLSNMETSGEVFEDGGKG